MSDTIVAKKNRERTLQVDPMLVRKASLATLCLWGDPDVARGTDYLTAGSLSILREIMKQDPLNLAPAMRTIASLSRFGPDGRAAAEWIRSAAAFADGATLDISHFEETALATLSHRIYDNFSPASAPEKTAAKEEAIMVIVRSTLLYDEVAEKAGVLRALDDASGARLATKLEELRRKVPAAPAPKPEVSSARARANDLFNQLVARFNDWNLWQVPLSSPPETAMATGPDQPEEPRRVVDYRARREMLVAAGIRTDLQVENYEELCRRMNAKADRGELANAGYLVQEFRGDGKSEHGIPRLHPDGLCYLEIYAKLEGRKVTFLTTKPMVNVWDDAAALPGVQRFVELAKPARKPDPEMSPEDIARRFRRLMTDPAPGGNTTPAAKEAFVPTQRVDFYVAALGLHCLHQLARGSGFSGRVETVQQTLKSLRHRLTQEARHYRALCNKAHALFDGPDDVAEEDARLLKVREWLFRHPLLQDRRFLLEFLGVTRSEFVFLSSGV